MQDKSFLFLRLGMGITFIWIGFYIWQAPEGWGNYLQPWAKNLLLFPIKETMLANAVLDIVIGVLFLLNKFMRIAALVAAIHLLSILIVSGINAITVRDIGLLGAALTIFFYRQQQ